MGDFGQVHVMSTSTERFWLSWSRLIRMPPCNIIDPNSGAAGFGEQQIYTLVHLP